MSATLAYLRHQLRDEVAIGVRFVIYLVLIGVVVWIFGRPLEFYNLVAMAALYLACANRAQLYRLDP
jgi:hypothetical protein